MAQIKNNFLKSKMNKDFDARLVPNGEYREGRNISVSKSEGSDVGALENVKGNSPLVTSFLASLQASIPKREVLEVIGLYTHEETSSIYLFLTSWTDNSQDTLSNKFKGSNFVARIIVNGETYSPSLLLKGKFLNFSKNHPINSINVIENRLYWTDNRNQPRKININLAYSNGVIGANPSHETEYYFAEDQISVAKFAPYESIKFIKNIGGPTAENWKPTWKTENEEWLPVSLSVPVAVISSATDGGVSWDVLNFDQDDPGVVLGNPIISIDIDDYINKNAGSNFPSIKVRNKNKPGGGTFYIRKVDGKKVFLSTSSTQSSDFNNNVNVPSEWSSGDIITFQLRNPEYSELINKKEYLKDKFVRFSYRFKYDDNEYSLMAPFTQPLFISKNYNQFTPGDESKSATSTILNFFENAINSAELIIQLPKTDYFQASGNGLNFYRRFRVKEIEILAKSSKDNNVYSIDSIEMNDSILDRLSSNSMLISNSYSDNISGWPYNSQFFYEYKNTKPFQVLPERDVTRVSDSTPVRALTQEIAANRVMYGNYLNSHGAPKHLNYECFIAPKINNYNETANPPIENSDNTSVKEYYSSTIKQGRTYQVGVVLADRFGRQSNVILANNLGSGNTVNKDQSTVYAPFDGFGSSVGYDNFWGNSIQMSFEDVIPSELPSVDFYPGLYNKETNPLGWYSYKIVVKQQEQEYYNCYFPGSLSGNVVYKNNNTPLSYSDSYDISNFSVYGSNINKIPKNTTNVSSTDKSFGSKKNLVFRVVQTEFDANNLYNNKSYITNDYFDVVNIQPFKDFAPWVTTKGQTDSVYPYYGTTKIFVDPIYNADKNPFIVSVDISSGEGERIGFSSDTQKYSTGSSDVPPRFARMLTIAETNPTISNLDIYWETSTSGLISELNNAIETGSDSGAVADITPFLYTFQEKYPYDGVGIYGGSGEGKYLLQADLKGISQGGATITDPALELTLEEANINYSFQSGVALIPLISNFELVPITESGQGGATFNSWNLKLKDYNAVNAFFYDPISSDGLDGEITFQFKLSLPGFTPVSITKVINNNYLTNNPPSWSYYDKDIYSTWGNPKNDPNDVANVLTNWDSERIAKNLQMTYKKQFLSPFVPFTREQQRDALNNLPDGNASGYNDEFEDHWSVTRHLVWSISIRGKESVKYNDLNRANIGACFFNKNGYGDVPLNTLNGTNNNFGGGFDHSAVRFNKRVLTGERPSGASGEFYSSSSMFDQYNKEKLNLGNWGEKSQSVEPYIIKIEMGIINDTSSWNNWTGGGEIGMQGVQLQKGWVDYVKVPNNAGVNGKPFYGNLNVNENTKTFGYNEYPFQIVKDIQENSKWTGNGAFSLSTNTGYAGGYALLCDPTRPPHSQFDSWNNGKNDAIGEMSGNDVLIYRIRLGIREIFTGGLIGESQDVYIRMTR